jgi:hypothetical protein
LCFPTVTWLRDSELKTTYSIFLLAVFTIAMHTLPVHRAATLYVVEIS